LRDTGRLAICFPTIGRFMEFSVRLARELADYFAVQHEAGA
jgi:DNA-binding helix-hairpin-helix protein with protein kinase domain